MFTLTQMFNPELILEIPEASEVMQLHIEETIYIITKYESDETIQ